MIHDGNRVRAALAKSEFTQTELANYIGVARSTLSRILDQPSWRTDLLYKAGEALRMDFFRVYYQNDQEDVCVIARVSLSGCLKCKSRNPKRISCFDVSKI